LVNLILFGRKTKRDSSLVKRGVSTQFNNLDFPLNFLMTCLGLHIFYYSFSDIIWPTVVATVLAVAADQLLAQVASAITAVKIPCNGKIPCFAFLSIILVVAFTFMKPLFQVVFPCCHNEFGLVEWLTTLRNKKIGN
jgi:predicted PurR-regulated permease PerM